MFNADIIVSLESLQNANEEKRKRKQPCSDMYGQIKDLHRVFQKHSFFAANGKCEHSCFIKTSLQCVGDLTDMLSQCFLPGVTQETSI